VRIGVYSFVPYPITYRYLDGVAQVLSQTHTAMQGRYWRLAYWEHNTSPEWYKMEVFWSATPGGPETVHDEFYYP